MPTFLYTARDAAGRTQRGASEAPSPAALVGDLRARGWLVLDVRAATERPDWRLLLARANPLYWLPPRSVDVELALQELAVMLRSGLTLLTALRTVGEHSARHAMRQVWQQVAERIQEGASFAEALSQHRCFSRLVIQLMRVGEQTGTLEQAMGRAAETLERRRQLKASLRTALTYPLIVLVMALGVSAFMVLWVIPKLRNLVTAFGRRLPAMTQLLLDLSAFVQAYMLHGLLLGLALGGLLTLGYLWPPGRLWMDRLGLRIPILGRVFRLAGTTTFAYGLGVLLRSGITLLEGLRTVESLLGNRYLARCVATARERVLQGGSLAEPLASGQAFMPMLPRMVAAGEASGTLDEVLEEVARFHEAQLQSTVRQLSVLIEPIIIVVVGGIVGFVYVAFFLTLFAAAGAVR
ncbi:MAG: type II secretion system F family protein [Candidatus Tectimicrobiota bacterium]